MSEFKGTKAKDYLLQTSPNENYGLRVDLQRHLLRGVVEKEMEMYAELRIKESKAPEMLEMLEKVVSDYYFEHGAESFDPTISQIELLIKSATNV